ncbi:hypothetical protein [uncultured Anaerococcus sp.]|uniref:hypothetical protein n=1 Tax=uncultured Anaerococcus sp. TaxID=293428 RepID=UPI00288BB046|nr:hypothetical protein [uncultured Anaerococcus sp.]
MEKEKLLEEKKNELKILEEKILAGYKVSFLKLFAAPLVLAIVGMVVGSFCGFDDTQKVGSLVILFLLALFIFGTITKYRLKKQEEIDIENRLRLQREIVKLIKELRNENN